MKYQYEALLEKITIQEIIANVYSEYEQCMNMEKGVYIFGTALLGKYVLACMQKNDIEVNGFIDNDPNKQGKCLDGYMVYSLETVPKDALIVIATLLGWSSIDNQLQKLGYKKVICYEVLALLNKKFPTYNSSFENLWEVMVANKEEILNNYSLFVDEKSREIYDEIIGFRLTLDLKHTRKAKAMSICDGDQYFDRNVLFHSENEVFADIGGYDGESSKDFISWCNGNYKKVLFFEPDDNMLACSKQKLKGYENIVYYNCGIGAMSSKAYYEEAGHTGGGNISLDGIGTCIDVRCLDDYFEENITFMKADVEGFESNVLRGASKIITKSKPKIALSMYHNPEDIFALRKQVLQMRPDYKVYCRHYTEVYCDTVFYYL